MARNPFPATYADISESNLPAELHPRYTTVEYAVQRQVPPIPPVFLFVIDTCLIEEELQELKSALIMALSLLPENALVGLIIFGKTVQLFELGFEELPKSYVFNGTKEINAKQIDTLLSLGGRTAAPARNPQMPANTAGPKGNRFLMPFSDCEFTITSILEELQPDPNPVKSDKRPFRSTGVALSVATALLEATYPGSGARVMLFTGGPCTQGPGMVVSEDLREPIRSHTDLLKDHSKHTKKATKYYESVAKRAVGNGHVIDVFASSLDQIGFYEMQEIVKRTGGLCVLSDDFAGDMFKQSFQKIFKPDEKGNLPMAFNANIEIQTSKELKVCGAIGHCSGLGKKGPGVAETEIGMGNTTAWRACGLDANTALAFFFEVVNQHANPLTPGQRGFIQIVTDYQNATGQKIRRVTTLARPWANVEVNPSLTAPPGTLQGQDAVAQGFDQETATTLMARIAVYKAETEEAFDILRWLDRMLIRLISKFGTYRKDDPQSLTLSPNFSIYPQFMFHLRRSHFLQVFNNSPDETAFFRYILNRENVTSSLIMIQPTLESYSFEGPPVPVLLASTSVQADKILLLDTFFRVVVHYGENIAAWRKQGYHLDPSHENFRQLLQAPKDDAEQLMKRRFPIPRYVECDQHTSQARFLLATVDPVITHTSMGGGPGQSGGEIVSTDDVNMRVFMDHLKKLAVQS
eukprot:TRINITY_DN14893_c0_g1_i1.p1 TRINITY_DN14893_c0_g1~~TRINITY_DN14893_c0_g1_i1.p1  ORF type:complete len:787 (-),score=161.44 TRINITY_DN14893_c0_g1_i1:43-2118(-)